MWMHYALTKSIVDERVRESERRARAWRQERELREARAASRGREASLARTLLAAPVRLLSQATYGLSEASCTLATRIEGRTA